MNTFTFAKTHVFVLEENAKIAQDQAMNTW
jgi:hypothetical protein